MVTSLDQLFNKYNIPSCKQHELKQYCEPKQKDYVSLVQWFGETKLMPRDFKLDDFKAGFRLIPFGHDIYGVYEFKKHNTFSNDGTLNTSFDGERSELKSPLAVVKFNKKEFNEAKETWSNYWKWKRNRNQARAELEEQHTFDTKHAMHLVRLLRLGYEALTEGQLKVKRPDADELLQIRNGAWTYDQLIKYAEDMDNQIQQLIKKSVLPKKPDTKFAAQLLMETQDIVWQHNNQ